MLLWGAAGVARRILRCAVAWSLLLGGGLLAAWTLSPTYEERILRVRAQIDRSESESGDLDLDPTLPVEAMDMLDRLIRCHPSRFEAYYERATARLLSGDSLGALKDASAAFRLLNEGDRGEHAAWAAEAALIAARSEAQREGYQDALQWLQVADSGEIIPERIDSCRALVLRALGDTRGADECTERLRRSAHPLMRWRGLIRATILALDARDRSMAEMSMSESLDAVEQVADEALARWTRRAEQLLSLGQEDQALETLLWIASRDV